MPRDWVQQLKDTFQPHVNEPVQAVGLLQPAGALGGFGLMKLSPILAMFKNKKSNERAGGLAKTGVFSNTKLAAIVVTADKVYAFRAKQKGMSFKVQEKLGEWERKNVKFTVTDQKLTKKIELDHTPTGDHYELEAMTAGARGFHDAFFAEIVK
jgi:hypothetical protein